MASIDFTNIIADFEGSYLTETQINRMKDYWKRKAIFNYGTKYELKYARKGLCILVTYRCGRRISEVVGDNRKLDKYPGLRPCDLIPDTSLITFHILKKNRITRRTSKGNLKQEDEYKKQMFEKKPKVVRIAVDKKMYNILINFVKRYKIGYTQRIFPFSRRQADYDIKEAAEQSHIKIPGFRLLKNKITKEKYQKTKQVHYHMLRHSFAINLIKKNPRDPAMLPILQQLLCHSSIEVTKAYLQFSQDDRIKMLTKTFSPENYNDDLENFDPNKDFDFSNYYDPDEYYTIEH